MFGLKSMARLVLVAAMMLPLGGAAFVRADRQIPPQGAGDPQELPPVTYVCPMPQDDVSEDKPGICPICGMTLTPVRLDLAWSCPNHPAVITAEGGLCPIDKRELVEVTVAIHWECSGDRRQHFTEPGRCTDGTERQIVREIRAHGDHNPRHGGMFFMAADQWHHLEGTYPERGLFRVYLYDNFTKPKTVQGVAGRVAILDDSYAEVASVPLRPSADSQVLEAPLGDRAVPLRLATLLQLDNKTAEQRFDFNFTEYSKEPVGPRATTAAPMGAPASMVGGTAPATVEAGRGRSVPNVTAENAPELLRIIEPAVLAQALPSTRSELLALLDVSDRQVRQAVANGEWNLVYNPAMLGKDVALALENSASALPAPRRPAALAAVRRLVLAAWYLDLWGDTGNALKVKETYATFAAAVVEVKTAFNAEN